MVDYARTIRCRECSLQPRDMADHPEDPRVDGASWLRLIGRVSLEAGD